MYERADVGSSLPPSLWYTHRPPPPGELSLSNAASLRVCAIRVATPPLFLFWLICPPNVWFHLPIQLGYVLITPPSSTPQPSSRPPPPLTPRFLPLSPSTGVRQRLMMGRLPTRGRHAVPRLVASLQDMRVTSVSAGYSHSVAVTDQGRAFASGQNDRGQVLHGGWSVGSRRCIV